MSPTDLVAAVIGVTALVAHQIPLRVRERTFQSAERALVWLNETDVDSVLRRIYATAAAGLRRLFGASIASRTVRVTLAAAAVVSLPVATALWMNMVFQPERLPLFYQSGAYVSQIGALGLITAAAGLALSVWLTLVLLRVATRAQSGFAYLVIMAIDVAVAVLAPFVVGASLHLGRTVLGIAEARTWIIQFADYQVVLVRADETVAPVAVADMVADSRNIDYAREHSRVFRNVEMSLEHLGGKLFRIDHRTSIQLSDEYLEFILQEARRVLATNKLAIVDRMIVLWEPSLPELPAREEMARYLEREPLASIASLIFLFREQQIRIGLYRSIANWTYAVCLVPTVLHFLLVVSALSLKSIAAVAFRPLAAALRFTLYHPLGPLGLLAAVVGIFF